MADSGLFIGWGEIVRGRETEAVEHFNATIEYFSGLQADGTIESFEPVFLEPHGGDLGGFFFIRGDAEQALRTPRRRGLRGGDPEGHPHRRQDGCGRGRDGRRPRATGGHATWGRSRSSHRANLRWRRRTGSGTPPSLFSCWCLGRRRSSVPHSATFKADAAVAHLLAPAGSGGEERGLMSLISAVSRRARRSTNTARAIIANAYHGA